MFSTKTANRIVEEQIQIPNPKQLWLSLWHEGEVCCLFADSNVGKSVYAVQIAEHIAQTQPVVYFDFEMSDKQFQMRFTDMESGEVHKFPDSFFRATYNLDYNCDMELESIITHIALTAHDKKAKVVIIDNITWICNRCESGDAAGELMQLLIEVKRRHNLSILVLAHTPKRNMHSPLTQNSLAGSKRLANFMDSVMAIGCDCTNRPYGRYIKQIKVRSAEMQYGDESVIVAQLEKHGQILRLWHEDPIVTAIERQLLELPEEDDTAETNQIENILMLKRDGKSVREIAELLALSKTKVHRLLKKIEK